MQLLKVDHLKNSGGKTSVPSMSFKSNGNITMTPALIQKVCPESLQNSDDYFLHIYTNENPIADPSIGIIVDKKDTEGLKIRFDKSSTEAGRSKANILIAASKVIQAMTKDFDWPLGKDKKPTIKYVFAETSQLSDGTPIYILK